MCAQSEARRQNAKESKLLEKAGRSKAGRGQPAGGEGKGRAEGKRKGTRGGVEAESSFAYSMAVQAKTHVMKT